MNISGKMTAKEFNDYEATIQNPPVVQHRSIQRIAFANSLSTETPAPLSAPNRFSQLRQNASLDLQEFREESSDDENAPPIQRFTRSGSPIPINDPLKVPGSNESYKSTCSIGSSVFGQFDDLKFESDSEDEKESGRTCTPAKDSISPFTQNNDVIVTRAQRATLAFSSEAPAITGSKHSRDVEEESSDEELETTSDTSYDDAPIKRQKPSNSRSFFDYTPHAKRKNTEKSYDTAGPGFFASMPANIRSSTTEDIPSKTTDSSQAKRQRSSSADFTPSPTSTTFNPSPKSMDFKA